jgi:hypothetical protein
MYLHTRLGLGTCECARLKPSTNGAFRLARAQWRSLRDRSAELRIVADVIPRKGGEDSSDRLIGACQEAIATENLNAVPQWLLRTDE